MRRRDILARLDSQLERGNEPTERNREAFGRNREAIDRNTAVVELTQAVVRESTAAMHGVRDSLRGMGSITGRQVEVLQDLRAELRRQTARPMRMSDRLDRLEGRGSGEEPAPG